MALETGTYVDDLVITNPPGTDAKNQGDDHLRLIKSVLKTTFPNSSRAFYFDQVLSKTAAYTIVAANQNALILCDASGAAFSVDLPQASTVFAGFRVAVKKTDSSANAVTVDGYLTETIDGATTRTLGTQYDCEAYECDGTNWAIVAHYDPTVLGTVVTKNTGVGNDQVPLMDATGYPAADGSQITGINPFVAGTKMLFAQTAAPTGWTKDTTHNNKALRVVTGTVGSGGATAFTSVFGSSKVTGSHTLLEAEMPAHTHDLAIGGAGSGTVGPAGTGPSATAKTSTSTGGDGGHTHTLSLDLQYADVIIATKD